ncbi:PTS system fructose-specific EIIB'BC component [Austwickia sp. TVS 96-490-7B]|uniref:PTS fructose transporter subunit IIC n=1 Tax=Austwickia sp. TVS 96-490-7B TaxID=2830843 RepID=UPI001C565634|nr:fructose-specific PTS transporter subunit EIIC [Austwickia sp. TVS 96-490-7B]MBW3086143.1 PTS system fructose-specific EIIB'BC component [Austwickia sp. TVS 96-490-7B]
MKFVGVTSCPTGIAHTYMAAEALEMAAQDAGHEMVVETQGSAGAVPIPQVTIDAADAVIFAHDLEIRDAARFAGKPTVDVGVKQAISDAASLIAQAEALAARQATSSSPATPTATSPPPTPVTTDDPHLGVRIRQWLMTGVSHMIPFVAAGGILIALGFMLAQAFGGDHGAIDVTQHYALTGGKQGVTDIVAHFNPLDGMHWAALLFLVGAASFSFLVPILSGYIAFGIADRPGLAPGIVGGSIATTMGAGFLGGIATGFLAGFTARWISRWPVHKGVRGIMPVIVIPLLSTVITGGAMILVLGRPIAALMEGLTNALNGMSGSSAILLGAVLGLMMGFDLGGPVNKVAYTFATTGLTAVATSAVTDAAQMKIMAAVMGAGMVAPLGMALATSVRPALFTTPERENGKAAWLLGLSFISEGAIPFAAADPLRVIAASMTGSAVTGALVMAFGSALRAPHGGIWVIALISNWAMFLIAVAIGTAVCAAIVVALKGYGAAKPLETALTDTPAT